MRLIFATVLLASVIAPAFFAPPVQACQPLSYYCFLNGQYYYVCGTQVPPPLVVCALDTVRDLHLPPIP